MYEILILAFTAFLILAFALAIDRLARALSSLTELISKVPLVALPSLLSDAIKSIKDLWF